MYATRRDSRARRATYFVSTGVISSANNVSLLGSRGGNQAAGGKGGGQNKKGNRHRTQGKRRESGKDDDGGKGEGRGEAEKSVM